MLTAFGSRTSCCGYPEKPVEKKGIGHHCIAGSKGKRGETISVTLPDSSLGRRKQEVSNTEMMKYSSSIAPSMNVRIKAFQ